MIRRELQYWDLDIPGLNEPEARHLASVIGEAAHGRQVILSDPRIFLTLRLDRATVEALRQAVAKVLTEGAPERDVAILGGVLDDMDDWLETSG